MSHGNRAVMALVLAAFSCACSSCDGGGGGGGASDTEIDTSWDGGSLTPCEGDPEPGEVCVPGGTYLLGCMPYDTQCELYERPLVEVTLSPFYIDEFEATYVDVIEFINSLGDEYTKYGSNVWTSEGDFIWASWNYGPPISLNEDGVFEWVWEGDYCYNRSIDAAAGGFGWLGARLFCEWKGERLPTEAEWEAAARGQTKWIYPCAWEFLPCWYGKYDCCTQGTSECFNYSCEDCCIPFHPSQP